MRKINVVLAIMLLAVLSFSACKKEVDHGTTLKKMCYVTEYQTDDDYSMTKFEYNADHLVSRAIIYNYDGTTEHNRADFTYSDLLLKEAVFSSSDTAIDAKYIYRYNNREQPDTIYVEVPDESGTLTMFGYYLLGFEGDMLKEMSLNVPVNDSLIVTMKNQYFYNLQANAVELSHYEYSIFTGKLVLTSTSALQFDTKRNPFYGIGLDYFFTDESGISSFITDKNITAVTTMNADNQLVADKSYTSTFEYNDNGFPVKIFKDYKTGSTSADFFTYQCDN